MSVQTSLAYRLNFLINSISGIVFITVLYYLWKAIYVENTEVGQMTWDDMKCYLVIVFISNTLLSWYSESALSKRILDGSVSMDLLKPLNFHIARFFETMGTSMVEGGVSVFLAIIWVIVINGIKMPEDNWFIFLFSISLCLSLILKYCVVYLASLFCFWTSSSQGIAWARTAITNLFSGALIPLSLFPDWLATIAKWLPFQGIVYIPASIYLGHMSIIKAIQQMVLQLFWILLLWGTVLFIWRWAIRKVIIHGG